MSRSARRLFIPVMCLLLLACVTPLMHPLRASNGFVAEASTSFQFGHGREASCDNDQGCVDGDGGAGGWNLLQLSGGYSWLFWEHVGVMTGLYFPGWENMKDGSWASTLALWSFFTLQGPYASIGVGPEVGAYRWALTAGYSQGMHIISIGGSISSDMFESKRKK